MTDSIKCIREALDQAVESAQAELDRITTTYGASSPRVKRAESYCNEMKAAEPALALLLARLEAAEVDSQRVEFCASSANGTVRLDFPDEAVPCYVSWMGQLGITIPAHQYPHHKRTAREAFDAVMAQHAAITPKK